VGKIELETLVLSSGQPCYLGEPSSSCSNLDVPKAIMSTGAAQT